MISLTVVTTGHAATSSAVRGSACVLLQARVGNTARAAGNGSAGVLAVYQDRVAGSVADALKVGDGGGSEGGKAKEDGEAELHFVV